MILFFKVILHGGLFSQEPSIYSLMHRCNWIWCCLVRKIIIELTLWGRQLKRENWQRCKMLQKTIWHWAVSGWGEANGHWSLTLALARVKPWHKNSTGKAQVHWSKHTTSTGPSIGTLAHALAIVVAQAGPGGHRASSAHQRVRGTIAWHTSCRQ